MSRLVEELSARSVVSCGVSGALEVSPRAILDRLSDAYADP
jgi:hypothetical protein